MQIHKSMSVTTVAVYQIVIMVPLAYGWVGQIAYGMVIIAR